MIAAITITITLGWWLVPVVLTAFCLYRMFRDDSYHSGSSWGDAIGTLFSLFWLIPIGFIWAIYFGLRVWLG